MTHPVVDSSAIVANYRQGLLEIEIPKKDEAKPKQIQINVGAKEEIHA
jgi:HSP20 family molecular chaperone IbpA